MFAEAPIIRKATVTLTAYNMGPDVTEEDFDSFARHVAARIDDLTGLDVTVEQFRFQGSGHAKDRVQAETEEDETRIRVALQELWISWCSPPETVRNKR